MPCGVHFQTFEHSKLAKIDVLSEEIGDRYMDHCARKAMNSRLNRRNLAFQKHEKDRSNT